MIAINKLSVCLILILFTSNFSLAQENRVQRILTSWEPPGNYLDEQKRMVGTSIDIVNKIKEKLNLNVSIELQPWSRVYKRLLTATNTVAFTAAKTPQRIKHGFHFIGPIFTRQHVLLKRKNSLLNITSLKDVQAQNLVVGGVRGDWRTLFLKGLGISVDEVTLHSQNVHKLINKRIDLWVTSKVEAPSIINQTNYKGLEFEQALTFSKKASYLMFSKHTAPQILKRWERAYLDIQSSGFLEKTSRIWSKKLKLKLSFHRDKGFYIEGLRPLP